MILYKEEMRHRSKKFLMCIATFVFVASYISSSFLFAYLRDVLADTEFFKTLTQKLFPDDISCFWENLDSKTVDLSKNSIYFHQTRCDYPLSVREACSVEAVARLHQNHTTYFLFTSPIDVTHNIIIKELSKLSNIKVVKINIDSYTIGTPFELFFKTGGRRVLYKNVADTLKFITLFKFGGIVIDFDVIVKKPLNLSGNWVVKDGHLNTAILKLSNDVLGQAAAGMVLSKLDDQGKNIDGDKALTEAFLEICSSSSPENINSSNCPGYQIYESKKFFPIKYSERYKYFSRISGDVKDNDVISYRVWDTQYYRYLHKDTGYAKVAKAYCPSIFKTFKYEFTNLL